MIFLGLYIYLLVKNHLPVHKPDYWKSFVILCTTSLSSLTKSQSLSFIYLPKCQYFLSIHSIAVRIIVSPLDCYNKTPNNQFYSTFIYSITAFYNVKRIKSLPPILVFRCSTKSTQKCTQFFKSIICYNCHLSAAHILLFHYTYKNNFNKNK